MFAGIGWPMPARRRHPLRAGHALTSKPFMAVKQERPHDSENDAPAALQPDSPRLRLSRRQTSPARPAASTDSLRLEPGDLLSRIQSHQLAYNRPTFRRPLTTAIRGKTTPRHEDHPPASSPCKRSGLIRHYDAQWPPRKKLLKLTRQTATATSRCSNRPRHRRTSGRPSSTKSATSNGSTVKDFVPTAGGKGTVASAGKIKGLRGAKLGNPICAGPLRSGGDCQTDHALLGPLAQRLEARMGAQVKANTSWPSSWPAPSIFHAQKQTVFDPTARHGLEQKLIGLAIVNRKSNWSR